MKKLFTLIAIASLGIFAAHAQELDIEADAPEMAEVESAVQEDSLAAHHKLSVKMFVDAGAGVLFMPGQGVGVAVPVYAGAWIIPQLGARVGFQGLGKNYTGWDVIVKADAMWNVTRTFHKPEDVGIFEWVPYASAGALVAKQRTGFCVGAGNQFLFRVGDKLQLLADIPMISEFDFNNRGRIPFFSIPQIGLSAGVRYSF